jgi:hypothetical protein
VATTFGIAIITYGWLLFGPAARTVDITVDVIDAETGEPVPHARVVVITRSYGIFDDRQLTFMAMTDPQGKLSFKQRLDYAIKGTSVIAYDQAIRRRGVDQRVTFAAYPVTGARPPGTYIHFYSNRSHFTVELNDLSEAEREKYRKQHEFNVRTANTTRNVLRMRGIEVGQ